MDGSTIANFLIRCIFVCNGFFYLHHFFLSRRHILLPAFPAIACLLTGIGFNMLVLYDIVLSTSLPEGIDEPFLVQYQQFSEILVTLVLGSYLLRCVGDPAFKLGIQWKLSVIILTVATNIYMIIRCIKIIATSVVLKDDSQYLIYTQTSSSSNFAIYICIILPQYMAVVSSLYYINNPEKEKNIEDAEENLSVINGCETCHILDFYYQLNIIYMGIVIVIVKPLLYFYSNNSDCDRTNEFLIVPPFVAVTVLFAGHQISGIAANKSRTVKREPVFHVEKTIP